MDQDFNPPLPPQPEAQPEPQPQQPQPRRIGRFKDSRMLVSQSWSVLKSDKEIVLFPLVGGILSAISIAIIGFAAFLVIVPLHSNQQGLFEVLFSFAYYLAVTFIATFFQAGLITVVEARFRGQNAGFKDGMANAKRHLGKIFVWSVIAATV